MRRSAFCFSAGLLLPSCHAHSLSREARICTYGHTAPTALRTDYTRFTHKHKTYGTVRTTPRLPPAPSPPYFLHIYAKRPSSLHIHSSSTSREPRICSSRHSRPQIREFYAPSHNMLQVNQLYNHDSQCAVPVVRNGLSRITIKPLRCCQKASLTRWKGQCRTATAALPHIHNSMHTLYSASKKAVWVILHHPARLHVMISYHNRKPLAFLFQTFLLSKFFTAEHA